MENIVKSKQELALFAKDFLEHLVPSPATATIIGLSGDLGAGKTAFTKEIALLLGVSEEILSPTFVLAKFYPLKGKPWGELVHIDAYRIEGENELSVLRWEEMIRDPKKLIVVEWPEQLGKHFSGFTSTLEFVFVDEHTRKIKTPP